jgi:hypothetical protein
MWHWLSQNADTIDKLGPLVASVSAFIAAFGALYVYRQYRRAQDWRKGDLAAELMERLESDEELAFACQALDWGTGPIMVPKRYRPLMKRFNMPHEAVLDHDPDILTLALEPSLNAETLQSAQGLVYRHCFIKLFNHIDNISRLVASEQVAIDDLDGLKYWVNLIASYGYAPEDRSDKEIFQPALALFGYHRIPELGRKLGVMDWSMYDETHASQISEFVGRPFMEARPVSGNLSNAKE